LAIRSKCCVSILACRNKAVCQDKWYKKHDKKKCPALMQDEVFGMPQKVNVEPAAEKQKYKFSVWHWTLNSQSSGVPNLILLMLPSSSQEVDKSPWSTKFIYHLIA
jgi:hypothetical protein